MTRKTTISKKNPKTPKTKDTLTVNLNLTDQSETSNLQAYVFSSGGKPLGSSPINAGKAAVIKVPKELDGRTIEVFLGPATQDGEKEPDANTLKRAGAYSLPGRYLAERPEINITIPGTILPGWCRCNVNGRVINRVNLPDGSVEEQPVCNARVHICEVDPWVIILPRIPDSIIEKLRDDILDKFREVNPPIPIPRPDPRFFQTAELQAPVSRSQQQITPNLQQFALSALSASSNTMEIRRQLLQLGPVLYPYWCLFPYIWRFYKKDCIRTVDVDATGRFNTTIYYDCNDQPDLYFWVEQIQDGVWTTVYQPNVACHTHWNYICGTEVVINAPNARPCEVPGYDIPDGVTLFVLPYKIGHTPIWGTPFGAPAAPFGWLRSDGFLDYSTPGLGNLYNSPFGGTLHFYHDDSYFIPKTDTDPSTSVDNSIKYYRYSYRRLGTTDWVHMTTPQARGYRMEYNDGSLPTYETYPIPPQTINGEPNLFEFKPRTPPIRPIDPPTVVVREWSTGNINDIAASWNTNLTAPAIDGDHPTDQSGAFEVKVEVFNESGQQMVPGASTFQFLARNSDGTTTRLADSGEIIGGAFVFKVHIDNNNVTAELPQPSIGGIQASDDCGFLRYDTITDPVHIQFTATHPNDHAVFDFTIKRGSNALASASTAGVYTETSAISAPPYNDIGGIYQHNFATIDLVGSCVNAAFAADLDIWGKATNGFYRLGIHSGRLIAFALAESEEAP
jgi:hypothetical protein